MKICVQKKKKNQRLCVHYIVLLTKTRNRIRPRESRTEKRLVNKYRQKRKTISFLTEFSSCSRDKRRILVRTIELRQCQFVWVNFHQLKLYEHTRTYTLFKLTNNRRLNDEHCYLTIVFNRARGIMHKVLLQFFYFNYFEGILKNKIYLIIGKCILYQFNCTKNIYHK